MKTQNLIKTAIALIITLTLYSTNAAAQDKITFTWQTGEGKLTIGATKDKEFTVNWGDGVTETKICIGYYMDIEYTYAIVDEYVVTIETPDANCEFLYFVTSQNSGINRIDCSGCSALEQVTCNNNPIIDANLSGCTGLRLLFIRNTKYSNTTSNLNVTGCSNLQVLLCENGNFSKIDMSDCLNLEDITFRNNRLQLSNLFAAQFVSRRQLGAQQLLPQSAIIGEELFSEQSVFNGIFTKYAVTKNGDPAPEGDYTVADGKLIFHATGYYKVTMTNNAVSSSNLTLADVTVEIDVRPVGISKNDLSNIKVYPNPTSDYIFIESGNIPEIKLYSLDGRLLQNSHSKIVDLSTYAKGIYLLSINGKTQKIIKK